MESTLDESTLSSNIIPLQGEFPKSMNPTMDENQLEREMEKKKIREEIIASEMIRRKELEAEVRMELMMEKQSLGMRPFKGFDHYMSLNSGFMGFDYRPYFYENLMNLGTSGGEGMKLTSHASDGGGEFLQVSESTVKDEVVGDEQMQDVALGKSPFGRDPSYVAAHIAGKSSAELAEDEVEAQVMASSGIIGVKRKADTSARACDEETAATASKELQKNWYCSLCEVSATSEVTLDAHFRGKKHKAKEAKSKSSNSAVSVDNNIADNSVQLVDPATTTSSAQEDSSGSKKWECSLCQLSVSSETILRSHLQGKKHKAKQVKLQLGENIGQVEACATEKSQEVADPESDENATEALNKWYCSLCGVSASSENNLNDHLQGKKHKAKAGTSDQGIGNMDHDSDEKVLEVGETLKEKSSQGTSSASAEVGEHDGNEPELTNSSSKKPAFGSAKIELEGNSSLSLQANSDAGDLKNGQTDGSNEEASLKTNQDTEQLQKRGYLITEHVKYWLCKLCNEGTHDEATMAAHRKSNSHMKLLRENGGGLISVSSIPKKEVDILKNSGEEASA